MVRMFGARSWVVGAACLASLVAAGHAGAQAPPYQIVLRSRSGEVVPQRANDGRTGGGYIEVVQRSPDTVIVLMRGAVVAGAEQGPGGNAAMRFLLDQDFEIVATRGGLRPPRLTLAGLLVGTLMSTGKVPGNAQQGPACAAVNAAGQPLLQFCLKPHAVGGGEHLFVNDRMGPLEAPAAPGPYCLHQEFELSAVQPGDCFHHTLGSGAAADFDPDPRLEARFNYLLRPFRGVPHQDFGFSVVLRVVEEPPPPADGGEVLPPPRPGKAKALPPETDQR